ncbi:hypothetical protein ACM66B_002244 [Microbotryomycetes sp. NB124-2]
MPDQIDLTPSSDDVAPRNNSDAPDETKSTTRDEPMNEDKQAKEQARLQAIATGVGIEGRNGLFMGNKVPLEIFLCVAEHVAEPDLDYDFTTDTCILEMTQVCSVWRKVLLSYPPLWSSLQLTIGEGCDAFEKAEAWATRSKTFLRSVTLSISAPVPVPANDETSQVSTDSDDQDNDLHAAGGVGPTKCRQRWQQTSFIVRQILRCLSLHGGASMLENMTLEMVAAECCDPSLEHQLDVVAACAQFVDLSAFHLTSFELSAPELPRIPAASLIASMTSVEEITAHCMPRGVEGGMLLPAFFQQPLPAGVDPSLRKLKLTGLSLEAFRFPRFPSLESLTLTNVHVPNLFGLLTSCAPTLTELKLCKITVSPPSNFLPNKTSPAEKDLPGTLVLSALKRFECSASQAAMLWTTPRLTTSTFVVESPSLHTVSLDTTIYYDPGRATTRCFFEIDSLSTFFRHSPGLTVLDVSSADLMSNTLLAGLEHVTSTTLTKVRLGSLANDDVVDKLHTLLPSLRYLDVVAPGGHSHVTLPALTRMANRLLAANRSCVPTAADWKLNLVAKRPTPGHTLNELRIALRTKLLALTASQVGHLTMSLRLNSPPNGLDFAVVKQEIVTMSTQPEPSMSTLKPSSKKKKKQVAAPLPASQAIVNDAVSAMKKWQARREEEWSIEWVKQTHGVELHWSDEKRWSLDL